MNISHKIRAVFLVVMMFSLFTAVAREDLNVPPNGITSNSNLNSGNKDGEQCQLGNSKVELDINNVRAMMLNAGDMWWDQGSTNNARYEIPKIDDPSKVKKHSLFAGAIWLGGIDASDGATLLVAAETYRQSSQCFFPGPIVDTQNIAITNEECSAWNRHFKVDLTTIEAFQEDLEGVDTSGSGINFEDIPEEILLWPGKDNPFLADELPGMSRNLAPFFDNDGNGVYNPTKGDYPIINGDQAIWWVMNDVGGDKKFGDGNIEPVIGLELQTMAFAFATSDEINNMTFYKNVIKNYGSKTLLNTYLGQWVDADLGTYDDDYVACDVGRGLGYCYNGKQVDEGFRGYGENPPSVGVDFFRGPVADPNDGIDNDHDCEIDEEGETIVMSKFMYYNNTASTTNGNPNKASDIYNYLRNIWRDGKDITNDGKNGLDQSADPANYMFPTDSDLEIGWGFGGNCAAPVTGGNNVYWSENTAGNEPADRRFLQSAGPFTLNPGAVNEVTIGIVWARAGSGGPTGSINLLKISDDKAQALFDRDFQILNGPDAPDLGIVELDQNLVLSIIPRDIGNGMTTETYVELDKKLEALGAEDPNYRFQGYLVYQIADDNVSVAELDDPDNARLIAQCDENDGITKLINSSFDPEMEVFVPELMINGTDEGLFHTLNIKQDAFTSEPLINWKKYHFMVIAYGHNTDPMNSIVNSDGQQYLQGRKNVKIYTAIPHKTENRSGGTILNADYGSGLEVTQINGVGNGGNFTLLTEESEEDIVTNYSTENPVYKGGAAPVYVKVYDPINVKEGDFRLKLYSRLVFPADSTTSHFQVGDTIEAIEIDPESLPNYSLVGDSDLVSKPGDQPQIAGRAVIKEFVSFNERITYESEVYDTSKVDSNSVKGVFNIVSTTDNYIVAKLEMLNAHEWGTFMYEYKKYEPSKTFNTQTEQEEIVPSFSGYRALGYTFYSQNEPSKLVTASDFTLNDYWELEDLNSDTGVTIIKGDKRVSEFNEQLLPEYGIAIELSSVEDPLYRVVENLENGFLNATATYDGANAWLEGPQLTDDLASDYDPWMQLVKVEDVDETTSDPVGTYRKVLDGMWSPYGRVKKLADSDKYGAAFVRGQEVNSLTKLANVDIVITSDDSKWSKCIVLDIDDDEASPGKKMLRSTEDNGDGVGIGIFPGYAIDLDRGIRLNMMFAESVDDSIRLEWDPSRERSGGKAYVYITNTMYDECAEYSNIINTIESAGGPGSEVSNDGYAYQVFSDFTWAGNMKVAEGASFLESDARISLRINKKYRESGYREVPEYEFSTSGALAVRGDVATADSALSLIRMVPNPYYAYSDYESNQIDNVVKITNLPEECTIRIYNASGSLIRTFTKDNNTTFIDWNLRNQEGFPIAGGVYFAYITVPNVGEVVVKWFGVVRPFDLDTF